MHSHGYVNRYTKYLSLNSALPVKLPNGMVHFLNRPAKLRRQTTNFSHVSSIVGQEEGPFLLVKQLPPDSIIDDSILIGKSQRQDSGGNGYAHTPQRTKKVHAQFKFI